MKIIVFKNGTERAVTGEAGKYWLVGDERVRKQNRCIAEIREAEDPAPTEAPEEKKPAPKKKPPKKKKEEAAEDGQNGACGK